METIKVNMNPNPLDVQTIHASQNDGEARQWEFELHNNGELIDTSEITEQLFFKAYKGGTEQILPENTSTPTTSPFKGDIKYPQGLLTDQEFTYRESPTEEDGNAKIKNLYGNTLVWNQLVKNGNFADGKTDWTERSATLSVTNNICRATFTGQAWNNDIRQTASYPSGHKYFISLKYRASASRVGDLNLIIAIGGTPGNNFKTLPNVTTMTSTSFILTPTSDVIYWRLTLVNDQSANSGEFIEATDFMAIDLTQMGLDITDPSEFISLFPLSYYSYNQGSLLSFNGNGIKTTGKNESNIPFEQGAVSQTVGFTYQASKVSSATRIRCASLAVAEKNNIYKCDWNTSIYDCVVQAYGENRLSTGTSVSPFNTWFTVPFMFTGTGYVAIAFKRKDGANITPSEIDAIRPNLYLADTESALSLPISTYFPTGMKSAGNVYDELTESKAISRVGSVDLGSLAWTYNGAQSSQYRMTTNGISSLVNRTTEGRMNIICEKYDTKTATETYQLQTGVAIDGDGNIVVYDPNYNQSSSTSTFKTAMNGVMLYYELATETETSFATASLVTETTEIPLSNNDGVLIGKCTEELSENPGFFDAKIKLTDADGECYSNKIQLHVERSPQ